MNDSNGSNGGFWIFALLILMGMFNGGGFGWGNNGFQNAIGYENLATSNEVQRGFDNQNSMANQREILSAVNAGTMQTINAENQGFHDMYAVLSDKYGELQRDIAALAVGQANAQANQNQCCCDTKMLIAETGNGINAGIAQNRYEAAMNTAAINANTTAQTQRILDAITGNRMAEMQNQINALQLRDAMAGVVRYPMTTTYGVPSPCFGGCGNNGFTNI